MSKIPPFWQEKYRKDAPKSWNRFYSRNENRFYKDRHWIREEFPEIFSIKDGSLLEVGCGVGNFCLPLRQESENLSAIYACDFSPKAIEILKGDSRYQREDISAFVADINQEITSIKEGSLDIITMIFVLSAIPPENFKLVIGNLVKLLKPGGLILLRDYARKDAAQLRFSEDRRLADDLFVRQDGTLAFYFDVDELSSIFKDDCNFVVKECKLVHSVTENIKKDLKVQRRFVQGKFMKL